ncbi:MAG: IS1 family transposase, partial [Syntrophobacteraceae bacterium CG07_land_8_20_14_0_80_61_8]
MDGASRFIFELKCGKKDRSLFRKTIKTIEKLINNTQDLSLITDGE